MHRHVFVDTGTVELDRAVIDPTPHLDAHLVVDTDRDVTDPDPGVDHDLLVGTGVDVDVDTAERAVGDAQATGLLLTDRHPALAERVRRLDAESSTDTGRVADTREQHARHDQPSTMTAQRADQQPEPTHDRRRAEPLLGMQSAAVRLVDERSDRGDGDRQAERGSTEDTGFAAWKTRT